MSNTTEALENTAKVNENVEYNELESKDMVDPQHPFVSSIWAGLGTACNPEHIGKIASVVVVDTQPGKAVAGLILYPHNDVPPVPTLASIEVTADSSREQMYHNLLTDLANKYMALVSDVMNHLSD